MWKWRTSYAIYTYVMAFVRTGDKNEELRMVGRFKSMNSSYYFDY